MNARYRNGVVTGASAMVGVWGVLCLGSAPGVVPMVVPTEALLAGADWRSTPLTHWNENGLRWRAPAVPDYQA